MKSLLKFPKDKRLRNKAHLQFVSSLPCVICRKNECEAAHIRKGTDGGIGLKPSDCYVVPLCRGCHLTQHKWGELSFWGKDLSKAITLANDLYTMTGNRRGAIARIRNAGL